jgi:hypothetical protein
MQVTLNGQEMPAEMAAVQVKRAVDKIAATNGTTPFHVLNVVLEQMCDPGDVMRVKDAFYKHSEGQRLN